MNQPTIADVARLAGVSVATVSRALRGLDKVHPETRDRVIAAAAQLDYIASPEAAGLASGRSRLIGVITPFMARWFFTEMMSAIEKVFRDHQHHILLMDLEERSPEVRLALTQNMMFKRVDGLIVVNVAFRGSEAEVIKRLNLPVVAVGNAFNGAPLVGIDDVGCAALGTQHLIDLGHTALGYVGKARPHNPHGKTRPTGCRASSTRCTRRTCGCATTGSSSVTGVPPMPMPAHSSYWPPPIARRRSSRVRRDGTRRDGGGA
jgi:LacI family repressor for deo operon, udp, cdd, tsx, nupC, and nupG